jgi:hypothetical protein
LWKQLGIRFSFYGKVCPRVVFKAPKSPRAMASGGVLPQSMPAMEAFKMIGGLTAAFPDLKFEVQQVMVGL